MRIPYLFGPLPVIGDNARSVARRAAPFILSALINNTFSIAFRADFFSHPCAVPSPAAERSAGRVRRQTLSVRGNPCRAILPRQRGHRSLCPQYSPCRRRQSGGPDGCSDRRQAALGSPLVSPAAASMVGGSSALDANVSIKLAGHQGRGCGIGLISRDRSRPPLTKQQHS
jgi:hypothetical protein